MRELVVTAADFHFRAAKTVPAGLTRIRLHNEGPLFHHVQLVRLQKGHTFAEFVRKVTSGDFNLPWATFVGGPDSPGPQGTAEAIVLLEPGDYAMICLISAGDHILHVAKGMALPLTVTGPAPSAIREPAADVRIALREYDFDVTPELTAGHHTIRIENSGTQPHHVALVRLGAGRTAADAQAWFRDMKGPPPDEPVGGTTALAPGVVNFVTARLVPGKYLLICFVPDAKDGQSHAKHGMVQQITVQ